MCIRDSFYTVEKNLAKKLLILQHKKPFQPPFKLESVLSQVEKKLQIKLAPMQKEAVLKAIRNRVLVITGGPGKMCIRDSGCTIKNMASSSRWSSMRLSLPPRSVSYTHLDVYKRQKEGRICPYVWF